MSLAVLSKISSLLLCVASNHGFMVSMERILLPRVTNCFYSFGMFVRNIKHRKVQRPLLLYLSVIGQLEEKAGVFGHLTVFKHFRTSGHQLQNFHCHFHFLPRSLKNSQSDAKCCSSQTKLHCTRVAGIFGHKLLIMSIF